MEKQSAGTENTALREHHSDVVRSILGDVFVQPFSSAAEVVYAVLFPPTVVRRTVEEVYTCCWAIVVWTIEEVEFDFFGEFRAEGGCEG
jgi:hypothetical protein